MADPSTVQAVDYTPLTTTKQTRIMIWRDEVAATSPSDSDSLAPSSSNTTSSHNSSNASASSAGSQHQPNLPRPLRLWRRLGKRLRDGFSREGPLDAELRDREEVRTGMYRESWAMEAAGGGDDEGGVDGVFGERQDRLGRAERLLNQGAVKQA